jgi:hypothetical protein
MLEGVAANNSQMVGALSGGFLRSMSAIAGTDNFASQRAGFKQLIEQASKAGTDGMAKALSSLTESAKAITDQSGKSLKNSGVELEKNLRQSKQGLECEITKQATEAASKEAPAWKKVLAVLLVILVIVIVVAVTILTGGAALAALGPLGMIAVGAVIGAAVGAATSALLAMAGNLWSNRPVMQGVAHAALVGAITGAIGGGIGAGVGVAFKGASLAVQYGAAMVTSGVLDAAGQFVMGGFSFKDFSWSNLGITLLVTALTLGLAHGAASVRAGRAPMIEPTARTVEPIVAEPTAKPTEPVITPEPAAPPTDATVAPAEPTKAASTAKEPPSTAPATAEAAPPAEAAQPTEHSEKPTEPTVVPEPSRPARATEEPIAAAPKEQTIGEPPAPTAEEHAEPPATTEEPTTVKSGEEPTAVEPTGEPPRPALQDEPPTTTPAEGEASTKEPWEQGSRPARYKAYARRFAKTNPGEEPLTPEEWWKQTGYQRYVKGSNKRFPGEEPLSRDEWYQKFGRKPARNPWGGEGNPEVHGAKVAELRATAEKLYPQPPYRVMSNQEIPVPSGTRKPDVTVVDTRTGEIVKVYEAAHFNADGSFQQPYEAPKILDYEALGIPYEFHPVGTNAPPGGVLKSKY